MSERTTSDHEFARLFSPKILDKLDDNAFNGGVHIFRSAPGAGKTTLLRAFTPSSLRAFWNSRGSPDLSESYQRLSNRGLFDKNHGPLVLGVFLSCASGYADLPPGAEFGQQSLFRGLFDCRVVLRTLRSVGAMLRQTDDSFLSDVTLEYCEDSADLRDIPLHTNALELTRWAERAEQSVYSALDSLAAPENLPSHVRFESVLWLQSVRFFANNEEIAPQRLLMVDDLHKLRQKQRALLIDELTVLRPSIPVWLAERTIALGDELLSQGARQGREINEYTLEDMWTGRSGAAQFMGFAYNILDRRMTIQDEVPSRSFSQCLRDSLTDDELRDEIDKGINETRDFIERHKDNVRYQEWLARATSLLEAPSLETLIDLFTTRILVARDESKRQIPLNLTLTESEHDDRESAQVRAAAELFVHHDLKIPYYFGRERLCIMATYNVEELLALAAALFVGIQSKRILRQPELVLSPADQEKLLKAAAVKKRKFVPKNHSEGSRAQRLLDAIGVFCRTKTYNPAASYAPGVTGVRLSSSELRTLESDADQLKRERRLLRRVLAECVSENLLVTKDSSASTARESGTVFYLNRTLCVFYDLPLQMGGWQDVSVTEMFDWLERGPGRGSAQRLEMI